MEKKAPLNAKKRNLVVGLLMLVAMLVFLDPFQFFTPKPTAARRDPGEQELVTQAAGFLSESRPAVAAVTGLFDRSRVVTVGGHLLVKEHLDFMADLIPGLAATPVRLVGVEFLLAADQADIDRLVTAEAWDEGLARRLYFSWQPLCAYQENINVLKAAWQFNKDRPAGSPVLRIIGLNVLQDLSVIKRQEDFDKPEVMKQVFAKGVPDAAMAERIMAELAAAPDSRMLVFCQTAPSLGGWPSGVFPASSGWAPSWRQNCRHWPMLPDVP